MAATPIDLTAVMLARQRWRAKMLQAISHSVNGAYSYSAPDIPEQVLRDQLPRIEAAAAALADVIVDGLVRAGADLVPEQEPPSTRKDSFRLTSWAGWHG